MANLLVEIGNTALKAAWSEETILGKTFRYQGERRMKFILSLTEREKPEVMVIATAGIVSDEEQEILEKECRHLIILDGNHREMLTSRGLPEYLSYDRASSIVAASFLFKGKSCSIFDFGTTLTLDCVAQDGSYVCGFISPGCRTRFKSLERYTRTLPMVNRPSAGSFAEGLEGSIQAGVVSGIKFEIDGHMSSRSGDVFVFTGGDAAYFVKMVDRPVFLVSDLVLMGLAIITDEYVKEIIS